MHVDAEAAVKLEKALEQERSQQEWHGESQRIDREQRDAFGDRVLGGGESQNDGQDRSHARGPAEGESETNHERSPGGAAAFYAVQSCIGVESFDLEYSGQVQTEQNNDYAGDLGQ